MIIHLLTAYKVRLTERYLDLRLGRANLTLLGPYVLTSSQIFFLVALPLSQFVLLITSFGSR